MKEIKELQFEHNGETYTFKPEIPQIETVGKKYPDSKSGEIFNDYNANKAIGDYSHAEGQTTTAEGMYSHVEGSLTKAGGNSSHAEGFSSKANANNSHAEGNGTITDGGSSHAEGIYSNAKGEGSHAEGFSSKANGEYSHAEGVSSTAKGEGSHAEGGGTLANGMYAHSEGGSTSAIGDYSHAEGHKTIANGRYSHVEGYNKDIKLYIDNINNDIINIKSTYSIPSEIKINSYITYKDTNKIAKVINIDVFNKRITINRTASSFFGSTVVSGVKYVGTGVAYGDASHVEGLNTTASGNYSHAEGVHSISQGECSHAEGYHADALSNYSHAEGYHVKATIDCQHVQGKYNTIVNDAAYIIGWGEEDAEKNIEVTRNDGTKWLSNDVTSGGTYEEPIHKLSEKTDISPNVNITEILSIQKETSYTKEQFESFGFTDKVINDIINRKTTHVIYYMSSTKTMLLFKVNYIDAHVDNNIQIDLIAQFNNKEYCIQITKGSDNYRVLLDIKDLVYKTDLDEIKAELDNIVVSSEGALVLNKTLNDLLALNGQDKSKLYEFGITEQIIDKIIKGAITKIVFTNQSEQYTYIAQGCRYYSNSNSYNINFIRFNDRQWSGDLCIYGDYFNIYTTERNSNVDITSGELGILDKKFIIDPFIECKTDLLTLLSYTKKTEFEAVGLSIEKLLQLLSLYRGFKINLGDGNVETYLLLGTYKNNANNTYTFTFGSYATSIFQLTIYIIEDKAQLKEKLL